MMSRVGMDVEVAEYMPSQASVSSASQGEMEVQEGTLDGLSIARLDLAPGDAHSNDHSSLSTMSFPASASNSDSAVADTILPQVQAGMDIQVESSSQYQQMDLDFVVADYDSTSPPATSHPSHRDVPVAASDPEKQGTTLVPLQPESETQAWDVVDGFGMPSLPEAPAPVSTLHVNVSLAQLEAAIGKRRQLHAAKSSKESAESSKGDAADESKATEFSMEFPNAFSLSSLRADQGGASL